VPHPCRKKEEEIMAVKNTEEAQEAILNKIVSFASGSGTPTGLLQLAEAWAWLAVPGQPHGGGAASPK
jgi:hypothetical protein